MKKYYTQKVFDQKIHFHNVMINNVVELIAALKGEIETRNLEKRIHAVLEEYHDTNIFHYDEQMSPIRELHPPRAIMHKPNDETFAILRGQKEKQLVLENQLYELATQKGIEITMPTKHDIAVRLANDYFSEYLQDIKPIDLNEQNKILAEIAQFFSRYYSCKVTIAEILVYENMELGTFRLWYKKNHPEEFEDITV